MLTGAAASPHDGSSAPMGIGELACDAASLPGVLEVEVEVEAFSYSATPHVKPAPAKKLSMKPTNAVPVFIVRSCHQSFEKGAPSSLGGRTAAHAPRGVDATRGHRHGRRPQRRGW